MNQTELNLLRSTIADAEASLQSLRQYLTDKRKELGAATIAPMPPAELERELHVCIDKHLDRISQGSAPHVPTHVSKGRVPGDLFEEIFRVLLRDTLHDAVPKYIATLQYRHGAPFADRPRLVESITKEIARIEAEEEVLVDKLNSLGVAVQHRPEVKQRRETERVQKERAERLAANRRTREAAINERHAKDLEIERRRAAGENIFCLPDPPDTKVMTPSNYLAEQNADRPPAA